VLVPATHFPEASTYLLRFWKMGGRDKGGHDDPFDFRKKLGGANRD
jgi:hypothetical protein